MPSETENLKSLVDEAVNKLIEHCDSVQIFVTLQESHKEQTTSFENGAGNFYARQGQIDEWLRIQKQYQKNWAIKKDKEKDDDES